MSMHALAKYVTSTMLVVVGAIHLLPVLGVLSASRLNTLYGIDIADPNLEILMRHRAVLFGLLGTFLIYSAFRASFQFLALIAGFVSVASFLWLAYIIGEYNSEILRVFIADVVAIACLTVAATTYVYTRRRV